jgi:hypothetical protein
VQPNPGVIYTSSTKKDEEHGGNAPDDSHLALLVSYPGLQRAQQRERSGRHEAGRADDPRAARRRSKLLHAVVAENTRVLPGLGIDR